MRDPSELLKTSKCAEPEPESVVELYSNNVAH